MDASEQTAASFDQDHSFMVVEVAGAEMFFQAISRTGQTVDSGVIRRQAAGPVSNDRLAARAAGAPRVPRLSQFALEHLLLLPLGAAIALVWVNTAARELLPLHLSRSRSRSTTSRWCSSSR